MIYVILACYMCSSIWLFHRLNDIKKHPHKYDIIPGFEEYKKSRWYWPPKKDYTKTDPPDYSGLAGSIPFIVLLALFIISLDVFTAWSRPDLSQDKSTVRFFVSTAGLFVTTGVLCIYSAVLSEYAVMFSKRPMAICCNLHQIFRKDNRSVAWKKMTIIVLAATIIVCPLHLLGLASTGYADSEKIIYRPYFAVQDRVLYYDQLQSVERIYDEKGREQHCYLVGPNGEKIDISGLYDVKDRKRDVEGLLLSYLPPDKFT